MREPAVSPARLDDVALLGVLSEKQPDRELRVRLDLLPRTGESGSTVEADRLHHRLAQRLAAAEHVQLLAVRYAGLDAVGHYYLRYARPDAFGDVSEDERRRFGRVLDDYYAYVDMLVGEAMRRSREDDLLMVVSGFGMEPLTFGKRAARACRRRSAVQRHARARAGRIPARVRAADRSRAPGARRSRGRRTDACSISSACRSRATWTGSRARTSSHAPSTSSARSRSFRPIGLQ